MLKSKKIKIFIHNHQDYTVLDLESEVLGLIELQVEHSYSKSFVMFPVTARRLVHVFSG